MDKRAMIAEIASRHGVRLDPDDPAFLLVELNHMVFEGKEAELKAQTVEAENRITGLIGFLQRAGDAYQEQTKAFTEALGKTIVAQMEADTQAAKARFDRDSRDAIRAALTEIERTVKSTMQAEITGPAQKLLITQRQNLWRNMLYCLAAGILGGAVILAANFYARDQLREVYIDYGKAVVSSWEKLDKNAKAVINAERAQ